MIETEYQSIVTELKKILKKRKITYHKLAKKMGVAEVTIKRFFADKSWQSSAKLFAICKAVNVSFFHLAELAKDTKEKRFSLTDEQDSFLADNLGYFALFRELYRKRSILSIQKKWQLSDQKLFKALYQLEKLELIALGPGNKVKIIGQGTLVLEKNSKLEIILRDKLTTKFLKIFAGAVQDDQVYLNSEIEMSEENMKRMHSDIIDLEKKYCVLGSRDKETLGSDELKSVRWLFCFAEYATKWDQDFLVL